MQKSNTDEVGIQGNADFKSADSAQSVLKLFRKTLSLIVKLDTY